MGDNRAVMIAIRVAIEHGHARRGDGGYYRFDYLRSAGFGKIGDTFNQGRRHKVQALS
jgi:hypothetical protein